MNPKTELPIGFSLSLSMDAEAMKHFSSLSESEQQRIVSYVSEPLSGDANKERIDDMVKQLHEHSVTDSYF